MTATDIIEAVLEHYDLPPSKFIGRNRDARSVRAREVCAYMLRAYTGLSWWQIADIMQRPSHASVHAMSARLGRLLETDRDLAGAVEELRGQDDVLRSVFFLERSDGGYADDETHAQRAQRPDVGAVGKFVGEDAVAARVPGQEEDLPTGELAAGRASRNTTPKPSQFSLFTPCCRALSACQAR